MDPDNDGDGMLDGDDQCKDQPETVNGFEDEDGCPDEVPPPPEPEPRRGRPTGAAAPAAAAP